MSRPWKIALVPVSVLAVSLVLPLSSTRSLASSTNIVYVLDASNSMWGQIDGTAKIETARDALNTLLGEVASEASVGLLAYGHRSEGDCSDIEVLAGLGERSSSELTGLLAGVVPRGKTPIAGALAEAGKVFPTNDASNHVVLISDGIETCDGDPCAVAGTLADAGIKTRIHAIGFDVDDAAREQLRCIADAGNGSYFDAANASEFRIAVQEASQIAQAEPQPAPEPAPPPAPARETVFFDDFESDLSEDWVVNNAEPDAFVVEDSNLLMLASTAGGFNLENASNVVTLKRDLPDGDWDAILTFTGEFKTGRDALWFGLWKDWQNYLSAALQTKRDCCGCATFLLRNTKASGGEATSFDVPVRGSGTGCGSYSEDGLDAAVAPLSEAPSVITLHKRGRSYHVSADLGEKDDSGQPIVYETDTLTSLRSPGDLSVAIGKWADAPGEMLILIDSVEIVSVDE